VFSGGLFIGFKQDDTQLAVEYAVDVVNDEQILSESKLTVQSAKVSQYERFFSQMEGKFWHHQLQNTF